MKVLKSYLNEVLLIEYKSKTDLRGNFSKFFQKKNLKSKNINFTVNECFISSSKKNVIRGMHFDKTALKNNKIIICNRGMILDVFLDIREKSKTYGNFSSIKLSGKDNLLLYIPSGFAHGFLSLRDNTEVFYLSSKNYNKDDERGFLWNSFGFEWPIKKPILSTRDKSHPKFSKNK